MNVVKKGFVVIFLACLVISGCAIGNLVDKWQGILCHPSAEMQAEAQAAIAFLDQTAGMVGGEALQAQFQKAKSTFFSVLTAVCVSYENIQEALQTVDLAGSVLQGQARMETGLKIVRPYPTKPDMPELRALVK